MREREIPEAPRLHPTLSGDAPGEPLWEYFHKRLPQDLPREKYEDGLSCVGFARLILNELGGKEKARIVWVEDDGEAGEDGFGHAYVVPINAKPKSLAYNNWVDAGEVPLTVREVRKKGNDVTDEYLELPWEMT